MTPNMAAKYWPLLEHESGNRILISPSSSPCGGGPSCMSDSIAWFDAFFAACKNCRVDYIATHHYSCDPAQTAEYLHSIYSRYKKQIWLTEFGCPYTQNATVVMEYMKGVLPWLEQADYIYRYSWFITRMDDTPFIHKDNQLLIDGKSELNELGKFYDNFKNE
ncbi:unnamed protein product [Owenia fusiformis]|uniref:Asl1-like glycosyl hydrolase catalytic domain-containing protein n=1 Tax=Owenia fusiformis TaxID=6347 RepID=A0A8S4Q9I1_OWEFU|nr:unnamed protein product [Owenia fusiformis]